MILKQLCSTKELHNRIRTVPKCYLGCCPSDWPEIFLPLTSTRSGPWPTSSQMSTSWSGWRSSTDSQRSAPHLWLLRCWKMEFEIYYLTHIGHDIHRLHQFAIGLSPIELSVWCGSVFFIPLNWSRMVANFCAAIHDSHKLAKSANRGCYL